MFVCGEKLRNYLFPSQKNGDKNDPKNHRNKNVVHLDIICYVFAWYYLFHSICFKLLAHICETAAMKKYKKMHRVVQTPAKPDRPCGADRAPSWSGGRHIEVGGDRGAALGGESARGHQVDTQGLLRRIGGCWVRACGMHDVAGRFADGWWVVPSLMG